MPTCPNGHQSGSDDWCEVCGHRMAGAVPPPPPPPVPGSVPPPPGPPGPPPSSGGYGYPQPGHQPPPPPAAPYDPDRTAHAELCPQCRTPREAMAPFCEECRYNFLTHSPTSFTPPPPPPGHSLLPPAFQQPQYTQPPQNYDYQGSRPSQVNRPAEPLAPEQAPRQSPGPPARGYGDDDWTLPPPAPAPEQPGPSFGDDPARPPEPAGNWIAVIAPDREYFTAMMTRSGPEAAGLNLPAYSPEQQLELTGGQVTIGRRRHSTGESPDIDLSRPPEDPGVSHQHAMLVEQPDGSWSVVDQDSTNGTTINGAEDPIQPFVPVPLREGDRVHVGAWTTITVRRG